MADALASGASVRKDVGVQVPPSAPEKVLILIKISIFSFCLLFYRITHSRFSDSEPHICLNLFPQSFDHTEGIGPAPSLAGAYLSYGFPRHHPAGGAPECRFQSLQEIVQADAVFKFTGG